VADSEHIDALMTYDRKDAGRRYSEALRKLGFRALLMAWAYDQEYKEFRFIIISDWASIYGSLKMYELLLTAYRAAALPNEITPLMLDIFAPNTSFSNAVHPMFKSIHDGDARVKKIPNGVPTKIESIATDIQGYRVSSAWVFHLEAQSAKKKQIYVPRKSNTIEDRRKFQNFEKNIRKLAA
jgi:hypothetical protein